MIGITGFGGYIPRRRLSRRCILEANQWFNPALASLANGERAVCNWDEDALTMAVEATRDCLNGAPADELGAIFFCSTSMPFRDRLNAGILRTALKIPTDVLALDFASCLRSGTSALIGALMMLHGARRRILCVASDKRRTKGGSVQELQYGDGAAAIILGSEGVVAEYIGSGQVAEDFIDHYRTDEMTFDYGWEERWIRDAGYREIVPRAVAALFASTGLKPGDVHHLIVPAVRGVARQLAGAIGVHEKALHDCLETQVGDCGTAHPVLMLADLLQEAEPDRVIVLLGWGQGCDALAFRTTKAIKQVIPRLGVKGHLARRTPDSNYTRHLAFNQLMVLDHGLRSETDRFTSLSALYRNRDMITALIGGCCRQCGTVQYPRTEICVNPNCRADGTQEPYSFRDIPARIQSWTSDNLIYCPDPPQRFGMVVFEGGGRLMVDFTDVEEGELQIGAPVRMAFRIKEYDKVRGFAKYFWKAVPQV